MKVIKALMKSFTHLHLFFLSPFTMWWWGKYRLGNRKQCLHQTLSLPAPWSCTSSLQNCEKYISDLYKLPSLRYFVIATQIDWDKHFNKCNIVLISSGCHHTILKQQKYMELVPWCKASSWLIKRETKRGRERIRTPVLLLIRTLYHLGVPTFMTITSQRPYL
jgi:hypothetical protein